MKQLIVLVTTIVLGVAVGALVLGLGDKADALNTKATQDIQTIIDSSVRIEEQIEITA